MYTVHLLLGDLWNDGHGKSHSIVIETNLTTDQILESYKKGCEVLGFDVQKEIAAEYGDNKLREKYSQRFEELGLAWVWHVEGDEDGPIDLDCDAYAELWLFAARLGAPKAIGCAFVYNVITPDAVHIGGYGLFT